jgi:uncharacterized membrane protein (UPF0127 family)
MLLLMRCGLLLTYLVTLTLSVSTQAAAGPDGLVQISAPNGATIQAEVADTTEKRAKGLMYRDSLAKDRGMLFTFAEPQLWTFWMKNTRIPLDIIWMDGKKRIVHIERNVPTCSRTDDGCPQYQPNDNAMYVLELAAGVADTLKLQRGSVLKFQVPS